MTDHLVACTCLNFRGEPDHEAERVAALVAQGYDQLTASRIVWCPGLLDPTIRYRRRVEHEQSLGRAFVGCLLDGLCRRWGLPTWRVETGDDDESPDTEAAGHYMAVRFDGDTGRGEDWDEAFRVARLIKRPNVHAERIAGADAALAPVEALVASRAYGASLTAIEQAIAQGRDAAKGGVS